MRIACAHQNIHIIKDRLLFSILRSKPRNTNQFYYFTVEDDPEFQYRPFFDDFGPPSLPKLCRFVHKVRKLLEERKENIVHFYSSPSPTAKSNMSLYISFFRMIHLNLTAKEAYQPIEPISGRLKPFRDASNSKSLLDLTVLDVLKGIQKAMDMNFFDFEKFDIQKWEELEQLAKGNMNWIVPNKLLAMSTPYSFGEIPNSGRSNPDNKEEEVPPIKLATPKDVIPTLKDELGITDVVRLNKKFYDAAEFKENGLNHTDLYFPDGTIPPDRIIQEFFKILDEEKSVVAVHCKAGLGRAFVSIFEIFVSEIFFPLDQSFFSLSISTILV
ncbi:hypothetical protein TRFO_19191 [Tritrichomonas foetus]|uniref:protein-tyrosine-phosphatase n=1 Tax=Tritrichomonas foetus TaxID=1144522 RepID=A0A1J4KKA3_9EUKA|nr:hypothetical protein TRFO_19191 [Tritrichomonas foetus]|eukprot:OHT11384.1 hypothetical protein TRFO_19191 [Tritrichomonas foetus]